MGSSALPSLDPFQDISPLPVSDDDDDARGISDAVNVSSEVKEGFVNLMVDDEDDDDDEEFYEYKGDYDDVDFSRNPFDIIIDDE